METTIDAAGRIVIPNALRDELGLSGGQQVEIEVREGRIEIAPAPTAMALATRRGVRVAKPAVPIPPLTTEEVRRALERVRR